MVIFRDFPPRSINIHYFSFSKNKNTLIPPAVLESPVSRSGLSAFAEADLANAFSEELKDDSRSIIELLLMGDKEIGFDI